MLSLTDKSYLNKTSAGARSCRFRPPALRSVRQEPGDGAGELLLGRVRRDVGVPAARWFPGRFLWWLMRGEQAGRAAGEVAAVAGGLVVGEQDRWLAGRGGGGQGGAEYGIQRAEGAVGPDGEQVSWRIQADRCPWLIRGDQVRMTAVFPQERGDQVRGEAQRLAGRAVHGRCRVEDEGDRLWRRRNGGAVLAVQQLVRCQAGGEQVLGEGELGGQQAGGRSG